VTNSTCFLLPPLLLLLRGQVDGNTRRVVASLKFKARERSSILLLLLLLLSLILLRRWLLAIRCAFFHDYLNVE
jgi:hypothetical protein